MKKYKDYCVESELLNGDKTLSFLYPSHLAKEVQEECYIRNKKDEFVVKSINDKGKWKSITATLNLEDLEGKVFENFDTTNKTISECISLALAGTGWTIGTCNVSRRRTVRKTNCSSFSIIQEAKKIYRCEFEFDTLNKRINIFEKRGSDKGVYFIDSLNLISLEVQSNSYDFYTRLIAKGKGDLKVTVENFQYSNKVKTYIWKDERYTNLESLTEDATAKLKDLSKPYKAYTASILDLANINEEYKDILNYELGDIITLISKDKGIREKQRIVKIVEYPDEPNRNTCEIANTILKFEDIQKEFQDTTDTVNNITTDNGTIDGNAINGIRTEQIYDFEAKVGKVVDLEVVNARIDVLYAEKANVGELNAVVANVAELNATKLNVADANIQFANINTALIGKADIAELNAVSGKINVLESDTAYIKNLVNGNLTSDNIHSLILTSSKVTVENGFIKNAMIENLDVSKINAGTISTDKFLIKSNDGGIEINGATQQFKDKNNKVRLQLGKDSQGNFNFILRGEDGTSVLLDHTGLKRNAIADGLIINNMIGPGAVTGDKVNIGSLIQEVNKDANTSTIKATKIQLDKEGQTLDIAFNTLKTNVDKIEFGGRNLVEGTDFKKIWEVYATNKGRVSLTFDGQRLEWISTGQSAIISPFTQKLQSGKQYTVSFEARGNLPLMEIYVLSNPTPNRQLKTWRNSLSETEFRKFTFTVHYTHNNLSTKLFIGGIAEEINQWLEIKKCTVMFEEGNKATSWNPAPEDLESRIESNSTNISLQQGKIEALISDTSIVEDGSTKKLKDAYANLKLTVNGLNSTIGSHTTNITNLQGQMSTANGNISKLDGKVQTVESKQVSFEQNLNGISQRVQSTESNVTTLTGKVNTANSNITTATELAQAMALGKMLNTDPIFKRGTNGVKVYNNSSGSQVTVTRIAKISDLPTTSTHCMEIKVIGGTTSPGRGGFYFGTPSRANAVFITRFIAKIPIGYSLSWHSNAAGTGSTQKWLTATAGTGKWTEYVCKVTCGSSGTFSTTNYFALNGGSTPSTSAPLIWYLAYATVFDVTDMDYTVQDNTTQITTTNNKVVSLETNLNGISSKVSNVESSVATINGNVTSLQNRMSTAESKITSSAIIHTVSSTINTAKQEAINSANSNTANQLKNYATTSSVTQTVNSWVAKFSSSGGSNLIKNSKVEQTSNAYVFGKRVVDMTLLQKGKKYTLTVNGRTVNGAGGRYLLVYIFNDDWTFSKALSIKETVDTTRSITFEVPSNMTGNLMVSSYHYPNDGDRSGSSRINWYCLTEGEIPSLWMPHHGELIDGSTQIDASGVTIKNGALRVQNKAGQVVLSGDSNGNLLYTGALYSQVDSTHYAKLEPILTNGNRDVKLRLSLVGNTEHSNFDVVNASGTRLFKVGHGGVEIHKYLTLDTDQTGPYNTKCYWENGTYRPAIAEKALIGTNTYYFNTVYSRFFGRDRISGSYTTVQAGAVNIRTAYQGEGCYFDTGGYFRPAANGAWANGHPNYRWSTVYSVNGINASSDLRFKENVEYIKESNDISTLSIGESKITQEDMYNFMKDEFKLVSYNYKGEKFYRNSELSYCLGFIAQDLKDSKVGKQFIIPPQEGEGAYSYNMASYIGVLVGALRIAVNKIETLEYKIEQLEVKGA